MSKDYSGVNFPKDLLEEVDKIISNNKLGYKSRAEFIKEAIRIRLEKFKETND